jgi:hypothetical protein
MEKALIDTDIWLDIMRGLHPRVREHAEVYWNAFGRFTLSVITVAEVVRGLVKRQQVEAGTVACGDGGVRNSTDRSGGRGLGRRVVCAFRVGGHTDRALGSADSGDGVALSAGIGVSECASLCACGGGGLPPAHSELAGGGIEAVVTGDPTRGNQVASASA